MRVTELKSVMRAGRGYPLSYLLVLGGLSAVVYPYARASQFRGWVVLFLAFVLLRTMATRAYHRDPLRDDQDHVVLWRAWVTLSASAFGCLLGALALIALPTMELTAQVVLTMCVAIVCTGSVSHAGGLLWPLLSVVVCALTPFAWAWHGVPSPIGTIMFYTVVVTVAVNIYMAWNTHKFLRTGFSLSVANEEIAASLSDKNAQLRRVSDARRELFAIAGHDLRQPVHAIGLIIAQLSEHDHPVTLRRKFDRLTEVSSMIADMLQELMDLSNLERDEYQPEVASVALQPILDQVHLSQAGVASRKGIDLRIARVPSVFVSSDAYLLRRILLNLVSNAVKYTFVGKVEVSCHIEDGQAIIKVADSGIGIPENRIDDVFEDYVRVGAHAGAGEGVGLGLSIVRKAVRLLGHELKVRSRLGAGSVFEILLPLARPPARTAPSEAVLAQAQVCDGTVLVVENDRYALDALVDTLRSWGLEVVSGDTLERVNEMARSVESIDLVVTDFDLGGSIDGLQLIAELKMSLRRPDLPALLLTGDMRSELRARAQDAGVRVAHKPISSRLLRTVVTSMLESKSAWPRKAANG